MARPKNKLFTIAEVLYNFLPENTEFSIEKKDNHHYLRIRFWENGEHKEVSFFADEHQSFDQVTATTKILLALGVDVKGGSQDV